MDYLGLALYAEGPTDYSFLCPLLARVCEDLCTRDAAHPVEVSEVLRLDHPGAAGEASRAERVVLAGREASDAWRILFIHADGAGDPESKRREQAQPAIDRLYQEHAETRLGVAVIPVRETEAWAIVDGDALRSVFGTTMTDQALGLPSTAGVAEGTLDPKALLNTAFSATHPSGQRRRRGVSPMLNALGEQVSLPRLRELAAFALLENELRQALRRLSIVK